MKKVIFLVGLLLIFSCKQEKKKIAIIYHTSTSKIVTVDSISIEFPLVTVDSAILKETWRVTDSIAKADSIKLKINDSLQFRKITKIINGGYNGFSHRWKLYENAKKVLENSETGKNQ